MVASDAAAQRSAVNSKAQRRLEHQRFTVDSNRYSSRRIELEVRSGPRSRPRFVARHAKHGDAQYAFVEAWPRAVAEDMPEPVAIVRNDHRHSALMLLSVGTAPPQLGSFSWTEELRDGLK